MQVLRCAQDDKCNLMSHLQNYRMVKEAEKIHPSVAKAH
jgi:hypothetical protein